MVSFVLYMGQGFNPNVPMKIIKYEIPVSELKALEGIQLGDKTGPELKSNDYFPKKITQHRNRKNNSYGTGRTKNKNGKSDNR